jgi:hypothetical protein
MRASFCLIAATFVACSSPRPQSTAIVGRFASDLTETDIHEIQRIASKDFPVRKIDAVASDRVGVEARSGGSFTRVILVKRDGKWFVDHAAGAGAEIENTNIVH